MSIRLVLTIRRNHITQKVKIAGQRTLCLSVQDDEYPTEIFIRQNIGPLINSEARGVPQVIDGLGNPLVIACGTLSLCTLGLFLVVGFRLVLPLLYSDCGVP